jgi:hypothetical protein
MLSTCYFQSEIRKRTVLPSVIKQKWALRSPAAARGSCLSELRGLMVVNEVQSYLYNYVIIQKIIRK